MSKPDFGPGDLVVCVDDGLHPVALRPPIKSRKGQVVRVMSMHFWENASELGFLAFGDSDLERLGVTRACYRFRKIDKADEQFTAQIRACKPAAGKVPA
jgi:hypothetical protein